jgi:hypothetical protein
LRRKRIWARSSGALQFGSGGGSEDLLSDFELAYGAQLIGCTVARILGEISFRAAGASTEVNPSAFAGILVEEDNGNDVYPFSQLHADWMFWRKAYALNRDAAGQDATAAASQIHVPVDVKSMRKLDELNESLYLRFQAEDAWNASWGLSVLVLLP